MLTRIFVSAIASLLRSSRANIPQFDAQHLEFLAFLTERLVAEGGTRARDAVFEVVVEPETVVAVAVHRKLTSHAP